MDDACLCVYLVFALSKASRVVQLQRRRGTCIASVLPSSRLPVLRYPCVLTIEPKQPRLSVEPSEPNRLRFSDHAFPNTLFPITLHRQARRNLADHARLLAAVPSEESDPTDQENGAEGFPAEEAVACQGGDVEMAVEDQVRAAEWCFLFYECTKYCTRYE